MRHHSQLPWRWVTTSLSLRMASHLGSSLRAFPALFTQYKVALWSKIDDLALLCNQRYHSSSSTKTFMKSIYVAPQKFTNIYFHESNLDLNPKHSHPLKNNVQNKLPTLFLWTRVCKAGPAKVCGKAPTCVLESPYGWAPKENVGKIILAFMTSPWLPKDLHNPSTPQLHLTLDHSQCLIPLPLILAEHRFSAEFHGSSRRTGKSWPGWSQSDEDRKYNWKM